MKPEEWTIRETIAALGAKTVSSVELTQYHLDRISKYNHSLKAFITVSDTAIAKARAIDEARSQGLPVGPLAGVLVAVKDLFDTRGLRTTYGGKHFANHVPSESATVVRRLEEAGAIVIGKTNLHEYAYGTTTENPHYGDACNPWNRAKVTGGSSGGSSSAIAAGLCTAAIGTDTGGSIRIPAALCGHVGFKPTYGAVSTYGVFPLATSLDHVGPMTKSVADAALMMAVIAGPDVRDAATLHQPIRSYRERSANRPLVLGVPRNFFYERCHTSVLQGVHSALQRLQSAGVTLREVEIPNIGDLPQMQTNIIASEALAVHQELLQTKANLYGNDVRQRLEGALNASGAQYVLASKFRTKFREEVQELFKEVDAFVTPTTPLTATDIGQFKTHIRTHEVNIRAHLTRCTNPWNLSGLPAVSIPCGQSPDGLPIGLQLIGSLHSDSTLLNTALAVEEKLGQFFKVAPEFR